MRESESNTLIPMPRRGRPRADEAGLVDERVLDAATALFLEQGFGRTTLDQVAECSHAGKTTLYKRYPGKEILFAAVVRRSIQTMFAEVAVASPGDGARERVRQVGTDLAKSLLHPRCVSFMRITAAEAESFPELAKMGFEVSFEGSVQAVAKALASGASDEAIASARPAAARFVEIALQPLSFQATFGCDPAALLDRIERDVEDACDYLEAKELL